MKITAKQMDSYAEFQRLPTLQELADFLCENEDNDIEYVKLGKEIGALDFINVAGYSSIFTKLKEYPYEFEIDQDLRLASVDGVQIATSNDSDTVSRAEYEALLTRLDALENSPSSASGEANPAGTVISYMASTVPTGYLECNGQAVSRTEYKSLFDVIGTTYGEGDKSTTFNVPDLRGEFLRGTGTNTTTGYSGERIGTHQSATEHVNVFQENDGGKIYVQHATGTEGPIGYDKLLTDNSVNNSLSKYVRSGTVSLNYATRYTSRPTNTSVLYCIKY